MAFYHFMGRIKTDKGDLIQSYCEKHGTFSGGYATDIETGERFFSFNVHMELNGNKKGLFDNLKKYVDQNGGNISWHTCNHDEENSTPCVIEEKYEV